jgi:hypothetical protein
VVKKIEIDCANFLKALKQFKQYISIFMYIRLFMGMTPVHSFLNDQNGLIKNGLPIVLTPNYNIATWRYLSIIIAIYCHHNIFYITLGMALYRTLPYILLWHRTIPYALGENIKKLKYL